MTSREKFEQAIKSRFGDLIDYRVCKNSDGEYMAWDMQVAWWAWQAAETSMAVQLANAESKCRELAAENSGLKAAFDKPQAYLSWHAIPPTWEDPLPCGEYLDVHDETGHKNSDGTDCWPVFAKPEIETPATDAFLAEVRAQGVEMAMEHMQSSGSLTFGDCYISLNEFAAQLRQEAAQ